MTDTEDGATNTPYLCISHARVVGQLAERAVAELAKTAAVSEEAMSSMPTPHVAAMAYALTSHNTDAAEELVDDLIEAGLTIDELCFDHLAPAARELGAMWDQDRLPFTEVALATVRLQSVLRGLPRATTPVPIYSNRGAVFAAVPGEEHTLGVMMAADHFRRLGWDISLLLGLSHRELVHRIAADDREIVGISCSSLPRLPALQELVADLRIARPDQRIVLSGHLAANDGDGTDLPHFDGVTQTAADAEALFEALLAPQSECLTSVQSLRLGSEA